jgi:mevalonate kinase
MDHAELHFYSPGKLLLTGEYLVMYGAESLAIPVRFGQTMDVSAGRQGYIRWEAAVQEKPWFDAVWEIEKNRVITASDPMKAAHLQQALLAAKELNPCFLSGEEGYQVRTNLDYPQEWGLGSSSTFLSNLAWWAEVDPLLLHRRISTGSGFDIACARSRSPVLFRMTEGNPQWEQADFHPSYSDHLLFVFLGKKMDTSESVAAFRKNYSCQPTHILEISMLTRQLLSAATLEEAIPILEAHELLMSGVLNYPAVKSRLFADFSGTVKSLGAWGGDFVLAASPLPPTEVKKYFENKGYPVLFEFNEMVINKGTEIERMHG